MFLNVVIRTLKITGVPCVYGLHYLLCYIILLQIFIGTMTYMHTRVHTHIYDMCKHLHVHPRINA